MTRYVHGLLICGLSYGSSSQPTLFTDYPIDAATIPAALTPLSSATQIVPCMIPGGISGFTANIRDLRDPLITANTPTATLQDDAIGTLSALFSPDPGWANTTRWALPDAVRVESSDTTIILSGSVAPTSAQIFWIGNEAIAMDGAATTDGFTHSVDVARAQCGSRAMAWEIDPSGYPAGDNGSRQTLTAYSRQVFDGSRKIECALYQFVVSENDPCAISSCTMAWYGHLADRPRQNEKMQWVIPVQHIAKTIADSEIPGCGEIDLAYCVEVLTEKIDTQGLSSSAPPIRTVPSAVRFRFTVYEFERLFNFPIHATQNTRTGDFASAEARLLSPSDQRTFSEFVGTIGGHQWVFKLTNIESTSANQDVVCVFASMTSHSKNASHKDNPATFTPYGSFSRTRNQGVNEGFIKTLLPVTSSLPVAHKEYKVRVDQGESAPKIQVRYRLNMPFGEAALRLLLSDKGGGINSSDYDDLVGSRGLGLNPDWINIGSAPAHGLTPSQGASSFLELAALYNEPFEYAFKAGDKIGDWFRNELALHNALLTFNTSTGDIGARVWARPWSSAGALDPIHYPVIEIASDETLENVEAIFIERGLDPVTLEATFRKPLQTPEARNTDTKNARTIKIWRQGNAITDQEIQSGPLSKLCQAIFGVGLGSPRVFRIPLASNTTWQLADQVTWTDNTIPTATGRGVSARRLFILGLDNNCAEGIRYAYCLEDVVNQEIAASASAGEVSSGLLVSGIAEINQAALSAIVAVESVASSTRFDVSTFDSTLWAQIQAATGPIHVSIPFSHNPQSSGELDGHREAFATLTGYVYDSNAKRSYLTLTFSSGWLDDRGLTVADVIKLNKTIIRLPDHRTDNVNPGGTSSGSPLLNQSYNTGAGSDRIHLNSLSRRPRFDNRLSLIG